MNLFKIIDILLMLILLAVGIDILIKIKKSIGKPLDEVKPPLLIRINIIMVLTILIAIFTILNILFK